MLRSTAFSSCGSHPAAAREASPVAVGTRKRFEVFKRDKFTCRYCGRKSPEVVLECDHITPRSKGGADDMVNLVTSCWECNRGKSNVPLSDVITGEDPHDRAILTLERIRQLEEYNRVLALDREFRAEAHDELIKYWGIRIPDGKRQYEGAVIGCSGRLRFYPSEVDQGGDGRSHACRKRLADLSYAGGVLRRWNKEKN